MEASETPSKTFKALRRRWKLSERLRNHSKDPVRVLECLGMPLNLVNSLEFLETFRRSLEACVHGRLVADNPN